MGQYPGLRVQEVLIVCNPGRNRELHIPQVPPVPAQATKGLLTSQMRKFSLLPERADFVEKLLGHASAVYY
jgi:hypothetical protein